MTPTIQLINGSNTVDLYDDSDGFKIRYEGWIPGVSVQQENGSWPTVEEVFTLKLSANTTADLTTKIGKLNEMLRRANLYARRSFSTVEPTYLKIQLPGASNFASALVYGGRVDMGTGVLGKPYAISSGADQKYNLISCQLALTRHSFWEGPQIVAPGFNIDTVGGTKSIALRASGAPSRIRRMYFYVNVTSFTLSDVWAGFRSNENGNPDNFVPNWDCGLAGTTMGDGTARVIGVSDANNGWIARWTPGDTDMLHRATTKLRAVTANKNDQHGRYLVLLRARVTSGGDRVFHTRLLNGYYDDSAKAKWHVGRRVVVPDQDRSVAAGDFFYYPMGIISIPIERVATYTSLIEHFALRVEAQVASGSSGNLELDTFTLIPINEGGISIEDATMKRSTSRFYQAYIETSPDDEMVAYNVADATDEHRSLKFTPYNFGLPTGSNGIMVCAAQRYDSQVLSDSIGCAFDIAHRYPVLGLA